MSGFLEREPSEKDRLNPAFKWDGTGYRWSRAESQVNFPGIGSQPVTVTIRYNISENPKNPTLTVLTNDLNPVTLPAPPKGAWVEQSFLVPGEWFRDGDLHLRLKTTTFIPKNDVPGARCSHASRSTVGRLHAPAVRRRAALPSVPITHRCEGVGALVTR